MTEKENTITIKVWDNENKSFMNVVMTFKGAFNDTVKRNIRKACEPLTVCKFYEDTITEQLAYKYVMSEDTFYKYARKMEKRPQGDYVSRTATATRYGVMLYNEYTDDVESVTRIISGDNDEIAEKTIRKEFKNTDKIVLDIVPQDKITALYVMPVSEFKERATIA